MLYNNLSAYLKRKYGSAVKKICIDGGFSCPNRDGRVGYGGCVYCGERGAGEHISGACSIGEQVRLRLLRARSTDRFIAYFQSFTNTYAHISVLKERYDSALIDDRIVCLAIGTRPDCITEEIAELIASYRDRVDVWVELGLQSSSDKTARLINRGYDTHVYREAVAILRGHGIPVVTHVIFGLPGEGVPDMLDTVRCVRECGSWGIKIHSMYVMEGTALADMYRRGEYTPITKETYVKAVAKAIASLDPDMVVHRITGDCPQGLLVAPGWNKDKNRVIQEVRDTLAERGWYQGSCLGEVTVY